jgi:hypothetical protein
MSEDTRDLQRVVSPWTGQVYHYDLTDWFETILEPCVDNKTVCDLLWNEDCSFSLDWHEWPQAIMNEDQSHVQMAIDVRESFVEWLYEETAEHLESQHIAFDDNDKSKIADLLSAARAAMEAAKGTKKESGNMILDCAVKYLLIRADKHLASAHRSTRSARKLERGDGS